MNPNLSSTTIWTALIVLPLVLGAVVWQVRASTHGLVAFAKVHVAKAALALIYLAGYGILLFSDVQQGTWSSWILPVGIVAWPVAWIADGWLSVREHGRSKRQVQAVLNEDCK